MRILYAIQGTGNGHIARSVSIIQELKKHAEVDILISGIHNELKLPIEVKYNFKGLGFIFGKTGGIDYIQTFKQNKIRRLFREIKQLPIKDYNFVISDFEPVSVWAAKRYNIPTISICNQVAVMHQKIKKPWPPISFSRMFIEHYAACDYSLGIHFEPVDDSIITPIIRDEIRQRAISDEGFGLVYLPSYSDEIISTTLNQLPNTNWIVFSKHSKNQYTNKNVRFEPINGQFFNQKLLSCHLVITAAGFGTTSEALHLGKKIIVVPMKGQYEQKFNAYSLKKLGAQVLKSLESKNALEVIQHSLSAPNAVKMNYPDNSKVVVVKIMELYYGPINEIINANKPANEALDYLFTNPNGPFTHSESLSF